MKTILTFMILLLGFNLNLAQQKPTDSISIKGNNPKTYKPSMKTANILLASGGGLMLVGGILIITDNSQNTGWNLMPSGQELAGGLMIAVGFITTTVSIPFYITAYVKKRRLKLSPLMSYEHQKITQIPITNFGLAINF